MFGSISREERIGGGPHKRFYKKSSSDIDKREKISVNGAQVNKDRSLFVCMEAGKCHTIMVVGR